jgi:hypothetical protein
MVLFFEVSMTDTDGGSSHPKGLLMLSERQRVTIATALTILAVVVIIGAAGALIWLVAVFFGKFSSVFMPLAVGGVAALVTKPWYDWLRQRLRLPKPLALVAVVLSITLSKEKWPQVVQFFEQDPWGQRLKTAFESQQETLVTGLGILSEKALLAGAGLFGALGSLLSWAVLPIYFGFFLMVEPSRKGDLGQLLPFLKEETRKDVVYLATEFIEIVVAFFRGQLVIAFLQGILYALGFSLVGLKSTSSPIWGRSSGWESASRWPTSRRVGVWFWCCWSWWSSLSCSSSRATCSPPRSWVIRPGSTPSPSSLPSSSGARRCRGSWG